MTKNLKTTTDGISYNIKAIETKFRGFTFRSRLEARWATMFELLGWNWDYEPRDFDGWIPDFVIYGATTVYVEVKPVIEFPKEVAKKIDESGCNSEVLILGQSCPIPFEEDDQIGWLREYTGDFEDNGVDWGAAVLGRWEDGKGRIGFCHAIHSFRDRISDGYDGGCWGTPLKENELKKLWGKAHKLTRWMKS